MQVEKPIFVFGTGRSGTTIFYEMMTEHPHFAWTSHLCNFFPNRLGLHRAFMRATDVPLLHDVLRRYVKPVEVYRFWDNYFNGFSVPYRDIFAEDVSPRIARRLRAPMPKLLTENRPRLIHKTVGWSRADFLNAVFEDAVFVHVIRDGRAVANSLINVDFWDGWKGPQKWMLDTLPEHYQALWKEHDESFVALAGIQWMMLMDSAEQAKAKIAPKQILEIKYEDLCPDPIQVIRDVMAFCGMEWNPLFESRLRRYTLANTNDKYKKDLSPTQQETLERVLEGHLKKYGYL